MNPLYEKYKAHLTKAQAQQLARLTERYKQIMAQKRADSYNQLHSQSSSALRGLQNMGLAGRKGNLVSGGQKAADISAQEAQRDYNQAVTAASMGYAEQAAARMANATRRAEYVAEVAEQQKKATADAEKYRKEYEAALARQRAAEAQYRKMLEERSKQEAERERTAPAIREMAAMKQAAQNGRPAMWNQRETDSGSALGTAYDPYAHGTAENIRYYQSEAQKNGLKGADANRYAVQKAADIANRQGAAANAITTEQQRRASENINAVMQRPEYRFSSEYGVDMQKVRREDPDGAADMTKRITAAYNDIDKKTSAWEKAIEYGERAMSVKENFQGKSEAVKNMQTARKEMAAAYATLGRMQVAATQPVEYRDLYMMTDEEFDVAYDAAKKLYEDASQGRVIAGYHAAPSEADIKTQTERFTKYEQARLAREMTTELAYKHNLVPVESKEKHVKDGMQARKVDYYPINNKYEGKSYVLGNGRRREPENGKILPYDEEHGTENSLYAAIINEYAPTLDYNEKASRYTASGKLDGNSPGFSRMVQILEEKKAGIVNPEKSLAGKQQKMIAVLVSASYMTDEEVARYNTILDKYGAKEADEYFEYLYDTVLPIRVNQAIDEYYDAMLRRETVYDENGNRIGAKDGKDTWLAQLTSSVLSVPLNIVEGITNPLNTLMTRQQDSVAARFSARRNSGAQEMRNAVQENFSETGKFFYGTGMSMADSAVVAAISGGIGKSLSGIGVPAKSATKIGSVLGGSLLGGSAYNSAYSEALQRGLAPEKARLTAVGQGINEMLFESLSLDMLVGHYAKGGLLKVSKKAGVNWIVNTLVQGGVEGSEEFFTDIANRIWDNQVNGIFSEELTQIRKYISEGMSYEDAKAQVNREFAAQLALSFAGGAISGGVMGGGASFLGMLQGQDVAKIGRNLDDAAKAEIRAHDFQNAEAQELLGGKLTDEDYGRLAMTRIEEMAQTDPFAADKAAQSLIDAMARTDVKVDKRNQTLKTGTENTVSFNYDGVTDVKQMSGVQVEALRFAQTLVKSKVGGVNINVANQLFDKNGNEQNGWYDAKTNTVHVSLNGSQSVVYTISHELTHRLKSGNEEAFASMRDAMKSELESLDLTGSDLPGEYENILGDYLVKDGEQRTAWEALIEYEMDRYAKHGITLDRESAEEEVVCRACETMLERSRLISSMISKNVRSAKTVAKFLASIYDDIASLKEEAESRGYVDGSPEKLFIDQYTDIEKIANAWANAMKTVSQDTTKKIVKEEGRGGTAFSLKQELRDDGQSLADKSMKYRKAHKAESQHISDEMLEAANKQIHRMAQRMLPFLTLKNKKGMTYLPDEVLGKTRFGNSSYGGTSIENTTICFRTLAYIDFTNEIKKQIGRPLTVSESFLASQMLYQIAKEPQCLYCYVSLDRKAYDEQLLSYIKQRDKVVEGYNKLSLDERQAITKATRNASKSFTADIPLYTEFLAGRKDTVPMRTRFAQWIDIANSGSEAITAADLATDDRRGLMRNGDDWQETKRTTGKVSLQDQVIDAERYAQSASWAKKMEEYRAYNGDILKIGKRTVNKLNNEYGLRFYSFSEYSPAFIVENMQQIRDAALKGLMGLAYTKKTDFARIFAGTGMNINVSTFGRWGVDADGNRVVVMDSDQGADWTEVQNLRKQYENVGAVFVATDDAMTEWAIKQDWIDVVIPFHIVRTGANVAEFYKWVVHNSEQNDLTDEGKNATIPAAEHGNSYEKYMSLVNERGLTPRFDKWRPENNPNVTADEYMKLVNETRRTLDETNPLQPIYDTREAARSFGAFVHDGGYYGDYYKAKSEQDIKVPVTPEQDILGIGSKTYTEQEGIERVVADIKAGNKANQVPYGRQDIDEQISRLNKARQVKQHGQKFSIKESDAQYLDLARRYESGDKSVEAELRKAVDVAAKRAGYKYHLYRGGGIVHNVFDTKRGKSTTQYGQGTYFTDGKGLAEEWAFDRAHDGEDGYVGEYYVRIGTLFDDTNIDTSTRQWKKVESVLKQYGATDRQINIAKEWGFSGIQRVLDSLGKAESKTIFGKGVDETNAILQNAGYDGIKGEFYDAMQYVIFDPTQAKSADLITKDDNGNIIPLSERFKTDRTEDAWKNEDIRYSIRGRGALYSEIGTLDSTKLRDKQGKENLNIAYKMDREGIDSEKIRLATGWFKGYDGKWRNEIDDSGAKLADWLVLGKGMMYMQEKARKADGDLIDKVFSLEDRLKKSNKANGSDSEQSKALRKELRDTRKQREEARDFANRISSNRLKLSDILDHAKLYKNYPQLKDVTVHLDYSDRTGYMGAATGTTDITIVTDLNSKDEILEVLMHEVQHIIQGIEGFAKGANVEYWADRNKRESADVKKAKATLAQLERDLSRVKYEGYPQASPLKTALMYAYVTDQLRNDKPGTANYAYDTEQKEKYEKRAEEGGYADLLKKYLFAYQDVKVAEMEAKDYTKAFADYQRTAGEVESRDVAGRLRMSEDERKATRPDIDRSDVTFVETDRTGENAWKNEDIRYSISTDVQTAIDNNGVVVNDKNEPVLNVIDHGDGVQYSYSTYRDGGRDTLKAFMKKDIEKYAKERRKALRAEGKTKAEIKSIVDADIADMRTQYERIMKQMDKIYEMSTKYLDKYASFGTWSRAAVTVGEDGKPVFSVIRANGEYPMNIDFSLVCVKRRALDAVMNEIVKNGYMEKLVLDGESLVKVNNILRRRGFEVACMGCFVEAKRFRQQKVAEDFAEKYNEIVKSLGGEAAYANFGQDETVKQTEGIANKKDSELNWTRVNELIAQYEKKKAANSRAGKTVEEAIAFELKENPKSRVLLKSGDFMSTRGMDRVAEVAPSILSLYNKQKGTGGPKAVFGDMQYLNDIFKKQWNVNKAYAVGGVRVQSFSDFVPRMFFDYCQMVADLATRKLPAHAYTKEESFVKLFGLTGMKINMSLFPKVGSDGLAAGLQYKRSKNGDIVYKNGKPVITYAWAGESFDYEKAKEIQADKAYGKNCGTIAVGISNEHIRMMMADPTIRMIIPYHKSSLNPIIAELMGIDGFTDYTDFQRTKKDGTAIDVDFAFNERLHEVGDVQKVVKEYLDWCKENGYTAKFEQFAYNADGSINENYYKLLEDFSLFDEQGNYCPQEAVQMVYPDSDSAFGSMDALLDEYLKRDNDLQEARDAMIPAIAHDIIREVDKKHSLSNTDFKSDKLGNTEYLKYLQLGKKVVNQTATEDEIREFKRRMNELSEDNRIAFLDKLREKLIRADEAAKVREVRDRQIARLKQEFRESKEKARERRVRSDLTAMLKKGNDRIVQLLSKPTENAHVPVQLAQAVSEYAQRLNQLLTTSVPKTGEFAGIEKQTQKGALNAQKILDALKRSYADADTIALLKAEDPSFDPRGLIPVQYDENGKMIKDDSLAEMVRGMDEIIQGKHLNELTTDELRYVMNTMRGVIHAVTEANKVTVDGESRNVYRTSRKLANEVSSASKVFGDKKNKLTQFMNRYVIESLGLRRIAKLYSGSDENATFVKMVDDLNQGAIEQERIKQTLRAMFNDVTQKYEKDMKTWYGKNAEWIDTGFGFKITKGMRVSLAMHILNEQNLRNVEKAGLRIPNMSIYKKGNYKEAYNNGKVVRLTKAQAEQIVSHMTEAEKAYFEVAKEFFHKQSGKYINRTSLKLLGFSKAIVDNYFPIQTDDAYRTVKYDDVHQNASVEHPGFLETRKGTANVMYLNDITAVVNRQIDGVAKYAGLAIPMRNWNNVMNAWLFEENENGEWVRSDDGRAHNVLENRMSGEGKSVMKYVDKFVTDLASSGINDTNDVDAAKFAAKLTSNYVKAVLTLNARVALSQLASVPTAAAEIPWKYLVQSFGGNVEGHLNRNASNELIDMYTPIFAMRRAGTQTEVSEVMKRKGLSDKAEQKLPWALGWITAMDTAATRRLWYACERWVKGETNIPVGSDAFYQEVAKRYERVIQNTQPNFTVLQRSPALRSKNAAARIITMFGTQRMQNAGVFIESAAEVIQAKDKATRKAALKKFGRTLSGMITAAIVIGLERAIVSALRGRMRPLQDEDKEITAKSVDKYIRGEIGTSLAGSFMYVGELYDFVSGIVGGITDGDSGYDQSFALPAAEALSTMIKFFRNQDWQYFEYMTAKDEHGNPKHTDHEKWLKTKSFVNELMTVASYATGLPLQNASKTILNGWVPLAQDISDAIKTGELNLWLHQSGKLDKKTTNANYKEWTNNGFKGSEYFYWENVLTAYGKRDEKIPILLDSDLSDEKKAMLLRMMDKSGATSEGTKVFKENGELLIDFANPTEKQHNLPMPEPKDAEMTTLEKLQELSKGGNVKLWNRPIVSGEEMQKAGWADVPADSYATVYTSTYGYGNRWMNFTPIKENGEILSPEELDEYAEKVINGEKDTLKLKIGGVHQTLKDAENAAEQAHELSELFYGDEGNEPKSVLSEAKQEGVSEAVANGVDKDIATNAFVVYQNIGNVEGRDDEFREWLFKNVQKPEDRARLEYQVIGRASKVEGAVTYRENGVVYRDYTNESWYKLSNRSLSNGTNKRYDAAKKLEQTGLSVDKTVAIYDGLQQYTKKADWTDYLKKQGLTEEQITIFLWSRGWAKLK